jgi:hypothetical protein
MSHFIEICKFCGNFIAQCRCMDCNKVKKIGVCDRCRDRTENPSPDKTPDTQRSMAMFQNFKDVYGVR